MIRVTNLTVTYNAREKNSALRDLNFFIKPGERAALLGANGAGKSTLLLSMTGILPPAAGSMVIDGIPVCREHLAELRRRTGMVFQNPDDQLFMPTVYEDVCFGPRNYAMDEGLTESRIDAVLAALGIGHLKDRISHKLSGGEKRLAALAGILVMEPSVLLLDEPSSFLDPRSRRNLIAILENLSQTMVIATHDLDLARRLCGRFILLCEGELAADGPAEDIFFNPSLMERCGL
jgi:cobalt/nickel transport system ATP-binding protein